MSGGVCGSSRMHGTCSKLPLLLSNHGTRHRKQ
jgi:hypothetical protein